MTYGIETPDGLDRLRAARESFLSQRRVPTGLPDWLADAWRRTTFHGTDLAIEQVPQVEVALDTPLIRAAGPILARLADHLAGLDAAVVLSDPDATVVGAWAPDPRMRTHLSDIGSRPGADLSESSIGVNGISQVLVSGAPTAVSGPEHLLGLYQDTVCASAPVSDPRGGRPAGVVAVVCRLHSPVPVLQALAATAAEAVSRELLYSFDSPERALLAAFRETARESSAVAVLDGTTRLLTASASALLLPEDLTTLEAFATTVSTRLPTADLILEDRLRVSLRRTPGASGIVAVVSPLTAPPARPRRRRPPVPLPGLVGHSPAWTDFLRALRGSGTRPVLLLGERGVGLSSVARSFLAEAAPVELEAGPGLLDRLTRTGPDDTLLIEHAERLSPADAARLGGLLRSHAGRLLVTAHATTGSEVIASLRGAWPAYQLELPTLSARTADLALLFAHVVPGRRLTQEALAVLQRHDWPENVAELAAVARYAAAVSGAVVGVQHLPENVRSAPGRPRLSPLERAERSALADALRSTDGNRARAAQRLGIARATLYRKLRRYGLD